MVGIRFGIMLGNSFRLLNLLARTNKLGLLPRYFRTLWICSISMAFFAMTNTIFFYENLEYFIVRSYDSECVIFSFKTMLYLFIIIFLNDTCQFLKIDTSIVFYITFDFHHHFPRKLYGALDEINLYDLIYRNQGFH